MGISENKPDLNDHSSPVNDLGLMGGMFDPVHFGHLNLAENVLRQLSLDELHFVPCGIPSHRGSLVAPSEHRLAMLELAIGDEKRFRVDDRECLSSETSYSFNTLAAVREERPDCRLYFVMGLDAFNSLPSWYRWKEIFDLAHIIVAHRPEFKLEYTDELADEYKTRTVSTVEELRQQSLGNIYFAEMREMNVSSTMVRHHIAGHKPLESLLPAALIEYIETKKLYTED